MPPAIKLLGALAALALAAARPGAARRLPAAAAGLTRRLRPAPPPPPPPAEDAVPELPIFKMLSYAGLAGAVNLNDESGAEDKLVVCYNRTVSRTAPLLVYPDLDNQNGTLFVSADTGASWDKLPIVSRACPDPGQPPAPLAPRTASYTVGMAVDNSTGFDRILILGGDGDTTNNVYYSDDCGVSWDCYDGEQEWDPRGACRVLRAARALRAHWLLCGLCAHRTASLAQHPFLHPLTTSPVA